MPKKINLSEAILIGDKAQVVKILSDDNHLAKTPVSIEKKSYLPLTLAALLGHIEIAETVLKYPTDLNALLPEEKHSTPLPAIWFAARDEQWKMVEFLIGKGALLDGSPSEGEHKGKDVTAFIKKANKLDLLQLIAAKQHPPVAEAEVKLIRSRKKRKSAAISSSYAEPTSNFLREAPLLLSLKEPIAQEENVCLWVSDMEEDAPLLVLAAQAQKIQAAQQEAQAAAEAAAAQAIPLLFSSLSPLSRIFTPQVENYFQPGMGPHVDPSDNELNNHLLLIEAQKLYTSNLFLREKFLLVNKVNALHQCSLAGIELNNALEDINEAILNRKRPYLESILDRKSVRYLHLENCEITRIPQSLIQLLSQKGKGYERIHSIVLNDNKLITVPHSLSVLDNIENLYLDNNPLIYLTPATKAKAKETTKKVASAARYIERVPTLEEYFASFTLQRRLRR